MDPIELPHGELPPPMLPPSSEITWLPRRRRHTPRHQRQPWQDPRIANIIQRVAPSFVTGQVATASVSSGTTLSATLPSSVTAGNCVIVVVTVLGTTPTVNVAIDSLGNLYAVPANTANTGNCRSLIMVANNSVGGACTVTVTPQSGTLTYSLAVLEYSGVGSIAGNRSIADTATAQSASTATPSISLTPQQSGSLLVAAIVDATGGLTWTPGGTLSTRRASITTTCDLAVADAVLSSTSVAAATASWTNGGTTAQIVTNAIVLRPAGTQAALRMSNGGASASTPSISTGAFAPKQGELLLAHAWTPGSMSTVADNQGNTWTKVPATAVNGSGGESSLWWTFAANGNSTTVTGTFAANSTGKIAVYALPGILPSSNPVDVALGNTGNGVAVSVGPSAATVIPGETALLFVGSSGTNTGITPQSGTTLLDTNTGASGYVGVETVTLSATGTQTMTATLSNIVQWSAILITIPTGGGSIPLSFVQSVSATATSGNLTPTLPFNTAPTNLLCAKAQVNNQTGLSSVTGTNTWSRAKTTPNASGGTLDTWYAKNIAGGKVQPTFAPGAVKSGVMLYELSGLDTTAPFDIAANSTGNGQSPSVVTGVPNYLFEVVFGGVGDVVGGKSITVTSPAVMVQAAGTTNGDLAAAFYTVFSPGVVPSAQTFGASIPTSASQYSADAVLFRIAGSPTVEYLAAAIAATSATSGALTVTRALTATVTGTSALTGSLTVTHRLVATVTGSSSLAGALTVTHRLSATVSGASALAGNLTVTHLLRASSTGASTLTGSLRVTHQLVATVSGVSALTGAVTVTRLLHGAILGTSVVSGTLTVRYETLPVVTSVAFALNAATTSPHPRNSATSRPFALNTAVTGVDV